MSRGNEGASDWLLHISEKSGRSVDEVQGVLARFGVHAAPVKATPSRLTIMRIAFSGRKHGVAEPSEFSFEWAGLKPGLWALATDRNLRGKSSVIEVLKWLLRGSPPTNLQDDVRSWIRSATLEFELSGGRYGVFLNQEDQRCAGRLLYYRDEGRQATVAEFESESDFHNTMCSFFTEKLDLGVITAWREKGGAVTHDWSALSGVLSIGTDYQSLLGDTFQDGLASRLLQMYLGLPWVPTLSATNTALQGLKAERVAHDRRLEERRNERQKRIDELKKELDTKEGRLRELPEPAAVRAARAAAGTDLIAAQAEQRRVSNLLGEAQEELRDAEAAYHQDRRALLEVQESAEAEAVFRLLEPTACPRCEAEVTEERRRRERREHECSVCGEHMSAEDDRAAALKALEDAVRASSHARKRAAGRVEALEVELDRLRGELLRLDARCTQLEEELSTYSTRLALEAEILMLRGRLDEASSEPNEPGESSGRADDASVLDAVQKVTEGRIQGLKDDLLDAVSARLVMLAKDFGMPLISGAKLRGNATLLITKGGISTSYSKLTKGEQLRVKVATVLAMMFVAEERGVGRHPGLLLVDSPKAQEVADADFDHLVAGIEQAVRELPYIQVVVASTPASALANRVPEGRMRCATGDDYLW